jgi:hypothetical protein
MTGLLGDLTSSEFLKQVAIQAARTWNQTNNPRLDLPFQILEATNAAAAQQSTITHRPKGTKK